MYYVYSHFDPFTEEIVYVGKGTKERAWMITNRKQKNPEHFAWLLNLFNCGYLPTDWTKIESSKLTNTEATRLEVELINLYGYPIFNRYVGEKSHFAKLNDATVTEIRKIKTQQKLSNRKIAEMFGVSNTQISNILTNKSWRHLPQSNS